MAVSKASLQRVLSLVAVMAVVFATAVPETHAESDAPAAAPTSDGTTLDQGIAYALMVAALALTYLIHPLDSSLLPPYKLL